MTDDYRGRDEIEGEFKIVRLADAADKIVAIAVAGMGLEAVCESPIELMLGAQLQVDLPAGYALRPQWRFQRWRMDFAITTSAGVACAFVECDGKEFHSTPEQIANDEAKNLAAARTGIPLWRFSGAQIHRDTARCVQTIIQRLER